jgi:BASS family bile acid:Na+ symporter
MKSYIEKNAGLVFIVAILLGIVFPADVKSVSSFLIPLLIAMLYVAFLRVDTSHVKSEMKKPTRLFSQVVLSFFVVPLFIFFVLYQFGATEYAVAMMLLAAMPAGLASPLLTSIAGGRVETSVVLSVVTHLLVPLSVPFLFWLSSGVDVQVNIASLTQQMVLLIGVPIVLAFFSRQFFGNLVDSSRGYHKLVSILVLAAVAYLVIIDHAQTIRTDIFAVITPLLGSYVLFVVLALSAFLFSWGRKPKEKAGFIVSRIYMNNALAIVLAYQFFGPEVTLITIMAEIPWFTTFGAYLWFQRKFIGLPVES